MKHLLTFALSVLFFSGSCKKEAPELKLPPYTQQGNNVVACKINGQIFITEGKKIPSSWSERGIDYAFYKQDSNIYISASEETPFDADLGLSFSYLGLQPSPLKNGERSSAYIYVEVPNRVFAETVYRTTLEHTGTVEVKYFQNNIIAGTFQFDAISKHGDTVHVTDGRFDISTKE